MTLALVALVAGVVNATAAAAPKAELWSRWTAHDPASDRTVDHGTWADLLAKYARSDEGGITRFDYAAVSASERARLERYIEALEATAIRRYSRREQLAYWINLYNALTVRVVLGHYPVASIRDIRLSLNPFAPGPWRKKLVTVEGERLSLDDIEHRIVRPVWRDPRIHYALSCAAVGCPNLARDVYRGADVDRMLDAAARAFVNHPRGVRVAGGRLRVSSLYRWYKADFGGTDRSVIAHLRRYAWPTLATALAGVESIQGDAYDWALNDVSR